jgi:hypothetical protein
MLRSHANANHHTSATESRGLCFQATLALGREARSLGLTERVTFVRWRVRRDVNFLEHWALALDDGSVLDMTAVQVDGNPSPLRNVQGYPANYVRPRRYPIAIVLAVMERGVLEPGQHYSRRLLWVLHRRLFRHEAGDAVRARSPLALLDAGASLVRIGATLCTGYLLEQAIRRMSRLLMRLE